MPTLADLQALRDKAQNQQPDPGISLSGPAPGKTPTFADLQALRDKAQSKAAPALSKPSEDQSSPGALERVGGVIAAPGFAAAQAVSHPIDSAKMVGKGAVTGAVEGGKKSLQDIQKSVLAGGKAISPGLDSLHRAKLAGYAAIKGVQAPFEIPMGVLEGTYGKLASEGSKMTQPDGKALISPSEASILPSLFIGSGKKAPSEFAGAAERFGMDFRKASAPEDIAKEITRASGSYFDRLANMIWHREPSATDLSKPGEVASNAIKNFQSRKAEENALWTTAENSGNSIQKDHTDQITALNDMRKKVADRIKSGEDTPDVKKAQAIIDRALGELGAPTQPEQQIIEKTKDVGGYTKTVEGQRQFPKDAAQTTTKDVNPTTSMGGKRFSETTQTPANTQTNVAGKVKTITQSPYSVTQRIVKGEAPKPARAGTAGDLVRARRAVNESAYSSADPQVAKDVKNLLQGGLSDVARQDKKFAQTHTQALQKTQKNADIYRDDAKASKFGFDEETLRDITAKMKNGRDLPTASLEKINNGVDNIKTPEDLLFLKRHLDKPQFSMALRVKAAAVLSDTGTDIKKVVAQRPMLEQIFKFSGMPPAKIKQSLDDLEVVSKEMDRYGIPSSPTVDPGLSKMQQRVKSIVKALTLGLAYSNPKQAMYHLGQAAMPSPNADALALQAFGKAAAPPTRSLSGVGVTGALGTEIPHITITPKDQAK